jgi:ribose transport system permease protein
MPAPSSPVTDRVTIDMTKLGSRRSAAVLFSSNQFGLLLVVIGFVLIFTLGTQGFASKFNLFTLGRVVAIDVMIGYAMMVVLVTGGLNLAVGAIGVSAAMFAGWLMEIVGLPPALAVPLTIGFGAFLGAINGYASVRSGVHSFIITLATMSIFFGAMIVLTGAQPFRALPQFWRDRLWCLQDFSAAWHGPGTSRSARGRVVRLF